MIPLMLTMTMKVTMCLSIISISFDVITMIINTLITLFTFYGIISLIINMVVIIPFIYVHPISIGAIFITFIMFAFAITINALIPVVMSTRFEVDVEDGDL